ncbi:MAG: HAD-IA family hydrolase [Gammaproteobacteria bacterium]|nr:HAD-IA family hydrolase [Gammaproteobacteria bacterium]
MASLRALIWDVDGTLIDNEESHRAAFNEAFAAAGLDWSWDEATYRDLLRVAGGRERIIRYVREHEPQRALAPDFDDFVRELHADKTRRYGRILEQGVALRPGVARLVEEARAAGLRQAIATTTSRINVDRLLAGPTAADLRAAFTTLATGESVTAKKPAPEVYERVLEGLGLPPAACLAIEDTGLGLRAATAAGIPTLVTVSRYSRDDDFSGALAVLDALGEPDAPCRVLAGGPLERACVDLESLKGWHKISTKQKERN